MKFICRTFWLTLVSLLQRLSTRYNKNMSYQTNINNFDCAFSYIWIFEFFSFGFRFRHNFHNEKSGSMAFKASIFLELGPSTHAFQNLCSDQPCFHPIFLSPSLLWSIFSSNISLLLLFLYHRNWYYAQCCGDGMPFHHSFSLSSVFAFWISSGTSWNVHSLFLFFNVPVICLTYFFGHSAQGIL